MLRGLITGKADLEFGLVSVHKIKFLGGQLLRPPCLSVSGKKWNLVEMSLPVQNYNTMQ